MVKFSFKQVAFYLLLFAMFFCSSVTLAESQEQIGISYFNSAMWQGLTGFEKSGDYLYCTMYYGLLVLDVSDPSNPEFVSQLFMDKGKGVCVKVYGNIAYVNNFAGFRKVDISDPHNPQTISVCKAIGRDYGEFAVAGDYLFIINNGAYDAVQVYDISVLENAYLVDEYAVEGFHGLRLEGNYLYATSSSDGVYVLDVSDPTDMQLAAHVDDAVCEARTIEIAGGYLFIGDCTQLKIYDIAAVPQVEYVGTISVSLTIDRICAIGDYLVVGSYNYGMIYDISDIEAPFLLTDFDFDFESRHLQTLEYDNGYIYYSASNSPFQLVAVDFSNPVDPVEVGNYNFEETGWTNGVAIKGNYVFVAAEAAGLQVIDYTTTPYASIVATLPGFVNYTMDIIIDGDYAYVSDGTAGQFGLKVVNIADPFNPYIVSAASIEDYTLAMFKKGNYVYTALGPAGINIVDVSDVDNPFLIGVYDTPRWANDVSVFGNFAYVADGSYSLQILDVSNPEAPSVYNNLPTSESLRALAISGHYAFLGTVGYLEVADIIDPGNPVIVGSYEFERNFICEDIVIEGNYLYYSPHSTFADPPGICVFDISDPLNPALLGSYKTPGDSKRLAVAGDKIAVDDELGLLVLTTTAPFVCGELNGDGVVNLFDIVFLIQYLYMGGQGPVMMEAADVNGSGNVDIFDITAMIGYLYLGGGGLSCP